MSIETATEIRAYGHFINGAAEAPSAETITRESPATGEAVAAYAAGTAADVARAVYAAREAFDRGQWPQTTGIERSRVGPVGARRLLRLAPRHRIRAFVAEQAQEPRTQGALGLTFTRRGLPTQRRGPRPEETTEERSVVFVVDVDDAVVEE